MQLWASVSSCVLVLLLLYFFFFIFFSFANSNDAFFGVSFSQHVRSRLNHIRKFFESKEKDNGWSFFPFLRPGKSCGETSTWVKCLLIRGVTRSEKIEIKDEIFFSFLKSWCKKIKNEISKIHANVLFTRVASGVLRFCLKPSLAKVFVWKKTMIQMQRSFQKRFLQECLIFYFRK